MGKLVYDHCLFLSAKANKERQMGKICGKLISVDSTLNNNQKTHMDLSAPKSLGSRSHLVHCFVYTTCHQQYFLLSLYPTMAPDRV